MIYNKRHEVIMINQGERGIAVVYGNNRLVWQAVRSCFGRGYWINDKPWINPDPWKNNE